MLHSLDNRPSSRHVYFTEDRKEAREIQSRPKSGKMPVSEDIPDHIKRKTAGSYRELEGRRKRVNELEKIYMDMAMQKELQKRGKNRKVCEDEIVSPTSNAVCKWRAERKR
ncbi:probable U3 small nucleolar RNA-associated protein 11 [Pyrus x bretschneideri]|uniref:probable U3 small nucleolar RNA-associated protein 11 n=1 Tax=Pyrus x bretschneideri TaxID=225117 RepID=UPI002030B365|nr:probable U3 small nucleolar RNA-associated protein 11 [Pyrus x bretschneideri]